MQCLKFRTIFFSRLQHQVRKHNLVVASYDVVRNDIDFFRCAVCDLKTLFGKAGLFLT